MPWITRVALWRYDTRCVCQHKWMAFIAFDGWHIDAFHLHHFDVPFHFSKKRNNKWHNNDDDHHISISIIDLSIKCETHFGEFVWQCVVSCKHKVLSHSKDESNENNNSVSFSSISCTVFTIYLLHQQWDTSVSSDKKNRKDSPNQAKVLCFFVCWNINGRWEWSLYINNRKNVKSLWIRRCSKNSGSFG